MTTFEQEDTGWVMTSVGFVETLGLTRSRILCDGQAKSLPGLNLYTQNAKMRNAHERTLHYRTKSGVAFCKQCEAVEAAGGDGV